MKPRSVIKATFVIFMLVLWSARGGSQLLQIARNNPQSHSAVSRPRAPNPQLLILTIR